MITVLNDRLADAIDLQSQVKQAHQLAAYGLWFLEAHLQDKA